MKAFTLVALFLSLSSMAQDPGMDPACQTARKKFCSDKQVPAEFRFCLMDNRSSVDEACRSVIDLNQKKFQKTIDLCRQQIWKICDKNFKKNVQGCFRVERDQFTGECGAAVRSLR